MVKDGSGRAGQGKDLGEAIDAYVWCGPALTGRFELNLYKQGKVVVAVIVMIDLREWRVVE